MIETALGASSSYLTVGDAIASWLDPSLLKIDYVAKHLAVTAKNLWQVALVTGIAIGAFLSMNARTDRGRLSQRPVYSRGRPVRRSCVLLCAAVARQSPGWDRAEGNLHGAAGGLAKIWRRLNSHYQARWPRAQT
jgi:hypothetical protein